MLARGVCFRAGFITNCYAVVFFSAACKEQVSAGISEPGKHPVNEESMLETQMLSMGNIVPHMYRTLHGQSNLLKSARRTSLYK